MKFLFVADSFKGSLTSKDIIFLLTKASQEVFSKCECIGVPLAEGGDGTIDAVIASENGQIASSGWWIGAMRYHTVDGAGKQKGINRKARP